MVNRQLKHQFESDRKYELDKVEEKNGTYDSKINITTRICRAEEEDSDEELYVYLDNFYP